MANVIISDNTNTSYDGNLSTANGFYKVEAHNLYFGSNTTLTLPQTLPVTFATIAGGGKCMGVLFGLYTSGIVTSSVQVDLREIKGTATLPVASPGIVTFNGHGFTGSEPVSFTTAGTLPTGVVANTVYYVEYIDSNTFYLNAVAGSGIRINFTGTSSGVHTLRVIRATTTKTENEIHGAGTAGAGTYIIPFKFATPYVVDTTANKWDFRIVQVGGSGTYSLNTSDATNSSYATWSDTKISAADGCTLVVADNVVIDESLRFGAVAATGYSGGICGVVSSNTTVTAAGMALLNWQLDPVSSYTIQLDGLFVGGTHSAVRIGTSAKRIPIAQQAIVQTNVPTIGTTTPGFYMHSNARYTHRSGFFLYGEIPTLVKTTLASDAATLQKVIVTTDDMSSVWAANDYICVGKSDVMGQGDTTYHQIDTIVGTTITLKANLVGKHLAGGVVFIYKRGINFVSSTAVLRNSINIYNPAYFEISGVEFTNNTVCLNNSSAYITGWDNANTAQYIYDDNTIRYSQNNGSAAVCAVWIPSGGMSMKRNYSFRAHTLGGVSAVYSSICKSGTLTASDNVCVGMVSGAIWGTQTTTNCKVVYENNIFTNGSGTNAFYMIVGGLFPVVNNNYFYGLNGNYLYSPYTVGQSIGETASGNTIDRCGSGINFTSLSINGVNKNMVFGPTVANRVDVAYTAGAYIDYELNSPSGALTFNYTYLPDTTSGSHLKITDYNDTINDDRGYLTYGYFQRTGPAPLTDNTVHTAGGYAMRFESTDSANQLTWTQDIPIGNIQNKTMSVGVWCKINSATYYANIGNYQMPRLTINYDNGTIAYAEAAQSTDWQLLSLPITPITTYGKINATLSTMTDSTGSNAYVYWDDFFVLYPAGVQLNLGNLDLWANGLPVMPTIATNVNANDVWAVQTSGLTGTGTIGKFVTKLLTVAKFLGLK